MKQSINVESYYIKKHSNGIYSLLFNTNIRWAKYHKYNDERYYISAMNDLADDKYLQEVPKFLPENTSYVRTVQQEKDQIVFYFIPFDLVLESKLIASYENNVPNS